MSAAVAVRHSGLEHLASQPLGFRRQRGSVVDDQWEPRPGLTDGLVVGGPQRRRGEGRVTQGHLGGDVAEEGHQRLQAHPSVDQGGGVGMPQLVRDEPKRLSVSAG
jgi:hypothetical protein